MTTPIETLREDLRQIDAKGKLSVLAAVSSISQKRLKEIMDGAAPTMFEMSTIQMLKQP